METAFFFFLPLVRQRLIYVCLFILNYNTKHPVCIAVKVLRIEHAHPYPYPVK